MWVVARPDVAVQLIYEVCVQGRRTREPARQLPGPPPERDLVALEDCDDVGVGVERIEEHHGVSLGAVGATAHGDAVRVQCERDQAGIDTEVVADLSRRPLIADVQAA